MSTETVDITSQALIKVDTECGLEGDAAQALRRAFAERYVRITEHVTAAVAVTNAEDPAQVKEARKIRLALKAERCEVEKIRKSLKEDSLRRGKAIDGYANVLKYMVEPVENRLEAIEKAEELREKARVDALVAERSEILRSYGGDPAAFVLRTMDENTWQAILETVKRRDEERKEMQRKAEAARAEQERKDAEERERQRQENIRLKAEAEAREAQAKAEREAAAKEKAELEAKLKAEREAKAKAEAEAAAVKAAQEKAEREAKAKAEAEARAKAEAEAKAARAKAEAEAKAAKEEAKAKRKAARAPDCEKLRTLAANLDGQTLEMRYPTMATTDGRDVIKVFGEKFVALIAWLHTEADRLAQGE